MEQAFVPTSEPWAVAGTSGEGRKRVRGSRNRNSSSSSASTPSSSSSDGKRKRQRSHKKTTQCPIRLRCRPTCAVPEPKGCPRVQPAKLNRDGCQCKEDHILSEAGGKCIRIADCPKKSCNGDPHARISSCPRSCQPNCAVPMPPPSQKCKGPCPGPGCECEPGYIRSKDNGRCILPDTCPGGNPCGVNGTFAECGFICGDKLCPLDGGPVQSDCSVINCQSGCICKDNYKKIIPLISEDQPRPPFTCVLASDCPDFNACASDCTPTCANPNPPNCANTNGPTCCDKGYILSEKGGKCIKINECPTDFNPCATDCTPTCANPNPPNCANTNRPTCCDSGYVLSEKGGKCIKIQECPTNLGCNGDPNAVVKQCPAPCASTCDSPNAFLCKRACQDVGCECNFGYLFNKEGKCVKPDQCPGGNPCKENEVFVPCKASCPTDYCPTSDSRAIVACDPPFPCLSGCVCRLNHRRKSTEDERCIVASDCPPVKCTRPHEKWSSCPSACASEYCEAVDQQPTVCNTLVLNCQPTCVCTKGHFRNSSDICISAKECREINQKKDDCNAN